MRTSLGLLALALALPAAAQTFDSQLQAAAAGAAQSARAAKAARIKELTAQAHDQAAALSAQYAKDPVAAKIRIDGARYGPGVREDFQSLAQPMTAGARFGIQNGLHLGIDGTMAMGPGVGTSYEAREGTLTEARSVAAAMAADGGSARRARFVAQSLAEARGLLATRLKQLDAFSPRNADEAAWKAKAAPAWTDLLAKVDAARAAAVDLRDGR